MKIDSIYNKKNNIFQSDVWAEFQKAVGREPIKLEGSFYYKEHLIRDKYFLYCPKGSSGEISNFKNQITNKLQNLNDQSIVFIRTEPEEDNEQLDSRLHGNDKMRPVTKNSILSQQYSPKQTLVLDLSKSEEEILANMKSKHRYNLRLAEKKGVKVRQAIRQAHGKAIVSQKDIDDFYKLSLEVSGRDSSYSPHPKSYYEKMVETIGKKGNLQIFTAEYEGKPLSSIIILFYNDTAIYLHGASSNEHRELMPNHLAQWEAIKEAKKRGCKFYDFWGASLIQNQSNFTLRASQDKKDKKQKIWDFKIYGEDVFQAVKSGLKKYETRAGNKKGEGKDLSQIKPGDKLIFSLADPKTDKIYEDIPKIEKEVVSSAHFDTIDSMLKEIELKDLSIWENIEKYKQWWADNIRERIENYGIWAFGLKGLDSRCGENDKEAWTVDEAHPWSGITKFKLGFVKLGVTGEVVEFTGAYDIPIDKFWYNGLSFINRVRKMIGK